MLIYLGNDFKGNDYGISVKITEPWSYLDQQDNRYNYIKSPEGVYKRSINYWAESPYGWREVLPRHLDNWGFQL